MADIGDPGHVAAGLLYTGAGCQRPGQACCGFPEVAFQGTRVKPRFSVDAYLDAGAVAGSAYLSADLAAELSRPAGNLRFTYEFPHLASEVRHELGAGYPLQVFSQPTRGSPVTGILAQPRNPPLSFPGHAHSVRTDSGIADPDPEFITLNVAVALCPASAPSCGKPPECACWRAIEPRSGLLRMVIDQQLRG